MIPTKTIDLEELSQTLKEYLHSQAPSKQLFQSHQLKPFQIENYLEKIQETKHHKKVYNLSSTLSQLLHSMFTSDESERVNVKVENCQSKQGQSKNDNQIQLEKGIQPIENKKDALSMNQETKNLQLEIQVTQQNNGEMKKSKQSKDFYRQSEKEGWDEKFPESDKNGKEQQYTIDEQQTKNIHQENQIEVQSKVSLIQITKDLAKESSDRKLQISLQQQALSIPLQQQPLQIPLQQQPLSIPLQLQTPSKKQRLKIIKNCNHCPSYLQSDLKPILKQLVMEMSTKFAQSLIQSLCEKIQQLINPVQACNATERDKKQVKQCSFIEYLSQQGTDSILHYVNWLYIKTKKQKQCSETASVIEILTFVEKLKISQHKKMAIMDKWIRLKQYKGKVDKR